MISIKVFCLSLRRIHKIFRIPMTTFCIDGPGSSSGKSLGYRLNDPGSIPGVGGVEIFLHSLVSRLGLEFTQPPIGMGSDLDV